MRCAAEVFADGPVDVAWYTTRERERVRGAALGPPRLRARQGLALGGLAGRPRRDRGRRLPLDARASTAASARRWAPRSRSARPARRCCRSTVRRRRPRPAAGVPLTLGPVRHRPRPPSVRRPAAPRVSAPRRPRRTSCGRRRPADRAAPWPRCARRCGPSLGSGTADGAGTDDLGEPAAPVVGAPAGGLARPGWRVEGERPLGMVEPRGVRADAARGPAATRAGPTWPTSGSSRTCAAGAMASALVTAAVDWARAEAMERVGAQPQRDVAPALPGVRLPPGRRPAAPGPLTARTGARAGVGARPVALVGSSHGAHPRRTTSAPGGAEAAHPLRQAGPAAVLLDPRLPAGAGAGAAPGRGADGVLGRLPPAPQDLLRQRRADRHGQRGRVLRDLGDRAGRPRQPARRAGRGAAGRAGRAAGGRGRARARWPTGCRPATG